MPAGPTVGRILPAIERPPSRAARLAARGATSLPELHAKQAAVKYAFEKRGTSKFVRKLVRTADLSDALAVSAELNALSDAELRDESMRLRNDGGLSLLHKSFSEATQRLQLAVQFELAIATRTGTNFSLASAATAANGGISGIGASTLRLPSQRPVVKKSEGTQAGEGGTAYGSSMYDYPEGAEASSRRRGGGGGGGGARACEVWRAGQGRRRRSTSTKATRSRCSSSTAPPSEAPRRERSSTSEAPPPSMSTGRTNSSRRSARSTTRCAIRRAIRRNSARFGAAC